MDPCYVQDTATISCLAVYIQSIIRYVYPFAAFFALVFVIWGGIKFVRSGGQPKAVEGAKKTLTYALGGLALIFLIWFIFWLIGEITGVHYNVINIVVP